MCNLATTTSRLLHLSRFSFSRLWLLLLAALLGAALAACTSATPPRPIYRIGFSQSVSSGDWRQAMLAGMERELAFHPEIQFLMRDAQSSSQRQQQQIHDLLQAGADVLIVAPNEEQALSPAIEEAYRRGVPVILLDRHTTSPHYAAYVGGDNTGVGAAAARYAAQLLLQRGQVVEITGSSSSVTKERHNGFVQTLRAYPQMRVVGAVAGDWGTTALQPALTELLRKYPETRLIFAHSDLMAQGAYEVCQKLGRKDIRIIGVDGLAGADNGLEMVQQGRSTASLFYSPGGEEAIRVALRILHHQAYERENILGTIVIDSTNALTLQQQAAKLTSQQEGIEQQQILLRTLQATYASQRTVLYGLVISLLAAVVLGASAWRAARNNRRINQELARQNEANNAINQELVRQNEANDVINRQLSTQNEEIRAQRNQIAELAEQARRETEAKLRFFTNFSHELRTPLTLIMGPVEEMLTGRSSAALQPTQRHDLGLIRRNTQRLLQLVNQLLDFRKIEVGKMAVQAHEEDVVAFVRELVETFEPAARVQQVALTFVPTEPVLPAWFDRNVLDKVFFNLLSNALKYTPRGGHITVRVQPTDDGRSLQVQVTDTGRGIRPQDSPHIFEWFYQGEQPTTGKGSGMGLALAQGLVRLHQGQLTVSSQLGQGSTFTVTLPRELPAELRSLDSAEPLDFSMDEPLALPSAEAEVPAAEAEALVLVIEDNADVNEFVARKLRPHFRVQSAADGKAGLQLATDLIPDLIVCDVMMPGLSGLEVVARLRADWRTSHIPVILLTARNAPEQQLEGVQAGADVYLTKPFNPAFLLESVRTLLANRARQREHLSRELTATLETPTPPNPDQEFVQALTAQVEADLTRTDLTVEELAHTLGFSRMQLYRKVKAVLGTSITDFIQSVRLQKACELLQSETMSVTAVAYEVGYASHSYFSNSFKARYGLAPSEFRARHQAGVS
ncbi:hybrid sensor histidine kinase/response regulator transcription factor [Hymenobacter swuensis]|uniref:histidine kinase n=1 Tax=Hymenobacter swuensis DY53 TaxID=1227739 RepID=W8EWR8_9BACT|nr:substrate-binding domain-containing protein [Hymenobacter swuensis]AHJ96998.1 histidine kinase [Hymenobacter swuensis DY53]